MEPRKAKAPEHSDVKEIQSQIHIINFIIHMNSTTWMVGSEPTKVTNGWRQNFSGLRPCIGLTSDPSLKKSIF